MPTPPFDDATARTIAKQLLDARDKLVLARLEARAAVAKALAEDAVLARQLTDLVAAGRVFGCAIAAPQEPANFVSLEALTKAMTIARGGLEWVPGKSVPVLAGDRARAATSATQPKQEIPSVGPTIRDRVLSYLQSAGSKGAKAATIRHYLLTTFGQETHEKTVGMTLYRLLKDGEVSRNGHTWFIAPATAATNPGGDTPGPINRDK